MSPMSATATFNATAIYTWKMDRRYRIYATPRELFFICYAGEDMGRYVWHQFGVLGAIVGLLLKSRRLKKLAQDQHRLDQMSPEDLLSQDKNNFKISMTDVVESSLEPNKLIGGHQPHFGRWILTRLNHSRVIFQLDTLQDMKTACDVLPKMLGGLLKMRVQWDEQKKIFVKKSDVFGEPV